MAVPVEPYVVDPPMQTNRKATTVRKAFELESFGAGTSFACLDKQRRPAVMWLVGFLDRVWFDGTGVRVR